MRINWNCKLWSTYLKKWSLINSISLNARMNTALLYKISITITMTLLRKKQEFYFWTGLLNYPGCWVFDWGNGKCYCLACLWPFFYHFLKSWKWIGKCWITCKIWSLILIQKLGDWINYLNFEMFLSRLKIVISQTFVKPSFEVRNNSINFEFLN